MTHNELRKMFKNHSAAKKITMNIIDFKDLLNETNLKLEPVCDVDLLKSGFYATVKIDNRELKIYVDKNVKTGYPVLI